MSFLLSLKSRYIKNKRPQKWKKKITPKNIEIVKNNPFWSSVYQRVCFGHLSWFSVTVICCVWFGALQTERDVRVLLEAIKVSEIGQLAMQTSLRSISSTFGSWLGTKNEDGRKKISLNMYQSFGKKKKKSIEYRTWKHGTCSF